MKRAIAVLTAIAVVSSTFSGSVLAKKKFSDVADNAWYASYVNKLSDKGIISGYSSGKFGPNDSLKVAQVIKMVVSALGYKNLTYYDGYVNKAAALGLVQPGEFPDNKSLERNITRGEIARIVIRALKNEKYPSNLNDYKKLIKDYNSTPAKFQEFVLKAYALGIVSGGPSGDFSAGDTTTRAAASKIILNMIDPSMRTLPTLNAKTETIAGFVVPTFPDNTKLSVTPDKWGGKGETRFQVNLLRAGVDKQIEDLSNALSQKCDSSTVKQVVDYIKQKKERFDLLPGKYIYDKKSKRYIWIMESKGADINVLYCAAGFKINN